MPQGISYQDALALAKSGDSEAQYAVSSLLHQRRQFEESLHWLRLAAAQGLVPARMTLATLLIDGRHCPRDRQQAIDLLQPLVASQIQAGLLLSEIHGFAALGGNERETSLRYLAAAARLGDAGALRQLGLLSIGHRLEYLARPLLEAAARRGDRAAAQMPGLTNGSATAFDWASLSHALPQLAREFPIPNAEILCTTPLIRKLPAVIPPLVLQTVINLAAPLVQRSQIVDARTGEARVDPMRNSSHVTLSPRQHDHVLEAIERCISSVSGQASLNGEFLQILRYRVGEEFRPHVDYFNESGGGTYRSLADGGQRAHTVLIYLNDNYGGGETRFPTLGINIKGRCGDMLHFQNLDADGLGHKDSLHAGVPVAAGEKWVLSQWIRSEAYPARLAW